MKGFFIQILLIVLIIDYQLYAQDSSDGQELIIKNIYENRIVLEEWCTPGQYSPANLFDDDNSTCFAEGGRHWFITLSLESVEPVICDEIRIIGGFSKSKDIFLKNNRPKEIFIYLSKSYDFYTQKKYFQKNVILEDSINYQKITFNESIKFKYFHLHVYKVYPGTKYNDTCITELKFFNEGKEIPVKDVEKLKQDYIRWVGERLKDFFKGGKYELYNTSSLDVIDITKDGRIIYHNYKGINSKLNPMPTRFHIKNSKLYMTLYGKTGLVDYSLFREGETRLGINAIGDYKYSNGPIFHPVIEKSK